MPAAVLGSRPKSYPASKQRVVRKEALDRWERDLHTPRSQKVLRIQPSINNDSLTKYQSRDSSVDGSSTGRLTPPITRPRTAGHMPISTQPRSGLTEEGRPKTPFLPNRYPESDGSEHSGPSSRRRGSAERPGSRERPNTAHSLTYSTRNSACVPPHLYNQDRFRQVLRESRPSGHANKCEYASRNQQKQEPKTPRRFGKPVHLPGFVKGNEFLTHQDLTMGQKQYIWGIAQVYSVTDLKILKQRQYQALLDYEFTRRLQNKELTERKRIKEIKEYMKYSRFIHTYDQRIPRGAKNNREAYTPCRNMSHLHKHAITGWTTKSPSEPPTDSADSSSECRGPETDSESGERSDKDDGVDRLVLSADESKEGVGAERSSEAESAASEGGKDEEIHNEKTSQDEERDDSAPNESDSQGEKQEEENFL